MRSKRSSGQLAKTSKGFSAEERAAARDRVQELKDVDQTQGEGAVLAKIAGMREADRTLGRRLHALIRSAAPSLSPKLWYGMPAYARDDKVVCFFQSAQKFKARYAMLGFSDKANLDEGTMWPVYFALTELTARDEARVVALVKAAVRT